MPVLTCTVPASIVSMTAPRCMFRSTQFCLHIVLHFLVISVPNPSLSLQEASVGALFCAGCGRCEAPDTVEYIRIADDHALLACYAKACVAATFHAAEVQQHFEVHLALSVPSYYAWEHDYNNAPPYPSSDAVLCPPRMRENLDGAQRLLAVSSTEHGPVCIRIQRPHPWTLPRSRTASTPRPAPSAVNPHPSHGFLVAPIPHSLFLYGSAHTCSAICQCEGVRESNSTCHTR